MRVAIYTRISRDIEGQGLGVKRQEEDCLKYCEDKGWEIFKVYSDNDITAMGGKTRPDYEAMLKAIRNRDVDAIVAWHPDRIHRSPLELESYIEACGGDEGIPTFTLRAGQFDLSTPDGRMMARIHGSMGQWVVEHNAENCRRAKKQMRENGLYDGRPPRYGYELLGKGYIGIVEEQAKYIRLMYDLFLSGVSLAEIAERMNDAGQASVRGNPFTAVAVRRILRSATNAGLIEYFGTKTKKRSPEYPGGSRGEIFEGQWEAIVDRDTWEAAVELLTDPTRYTKRGPKHTKLLTGIMVCSRCGEPITSQRPIRSPDRTEPSAYRCRDGHVQMYEYLVDDIVVPEILRLIRESAGTQNVIALKEELREIRDRLVELGSAYGHRIITMEQLVAASKNLHDRENLITAQLSSMEDADEAAGTVEWWNELDIDTRRGLVRSTAKITLHVRTTKGRAMANETPRISVEPYN